MNLGHVISYGRYEKYIEKPEWKIPLGRSTLREVSKFTLDPKEADGGCEPNNLARYRVILCTINEEVASNSLILQNKTLNFPLQTACLNVSL
jgi:hypothetical protein